MQLKRLLLTLSCLWLISSCGPGLDTDNRVNEGTDDSTSTGEVFGLISGDESEGSGADKEAPVVATETGQCNQQSTAGKDDPVAVEIDLGQTSGTFNFRFNTYGNASGYYWDRMRVLYENTEIYDSSCVCTACEGGQKSTDITYSGSSTKILVQVIPNCNIDTTGTAWDFTASCP